MRYMVKVLNNKIEVKTDGRGRPLVFSQGVRGNFRKVNYKVARILSWWREPGQWWEGEQVKLYLRLEAVLMGGSCSAGIFEIYRAGEEWYFHRLLG